MQFLREKKAVSERIYNNEGNAKLSDRSIVSIFINTVKLGRSGHAKIYNLHDILQDLQLIKTFITLIVMPDIQLLGPGPFTV